MRRVMHRSAARIEGRRLHGGRYMPKLTEEQKGIICRWIAEFASYTEVMKRVKEEFGITIGTKSYYHLKESPHWALIIDRFRATWVSKILEEPIAHKRTRLRKLAHLIEQAEADQKSTAWRKRREVAQLLDQVRLEMDEGKTGITNFFLTTVNQFNEEERQQRLQQIVAQLNTWRPSNAVGDRREIVTEAGAEHPEVLSESGSAVDHPLSA